MHIESRIDLVRENLAAAAALGDDRTREIATALATTAVPAMRLAILDAVGAVADEITAALLDHPGAPTVSIRSDGDDVRVEVRVEPIQAPAAERREDSDASARVSLRLPETLKTDVDAAADRDGVSVNTWLVRAAAAALPGAAARTTRADSGHRHDNHRVTGWING